MEMDTSRAGPSAVCPLSSSLQTAHPIDTQPLLLALREGQKTYSNIFLLRALFVVEMAAGRGTSPPTRTIVSESHSLSPARVKVSPRPSPMIVTCGGRGQDKLCWVLSLKDTLSLLHYCSEKRTTSGLNVSQCVHYSEVSLGERG